MNTFIGIPLPLLIFLQPVFQGNLRLNLDYLLYPDTGNNYSLEIFYEIPYSSLSFIRDTTGFSANYRLTLELFDRHKNILSAEVFERRVQVFDYNLTISRDSSTSDIIRVPIPKTAVAAVITLSDLRSERRAVAQFPLEKQSGTFLLRLLKSSQPNPSRTYNLNDTIQILAQIPPEYHFDSLRLTIKSGGRNIIQEKLMVVESAGVKKAEFRLPVVDTSSRYRLSSGVYLVEVSPFSQDTPQGTVEFKVDLPFYFDDSLWSARVDQLLYIATYEEMKKLKKTKKEFRKEAWDEFWQNKDPNPSTELNEREEEYFERINYCEQRYSKGDRGYRSDRARIYITYGPPDQIEYRPFEIDRPAEEIWHYYRENRTFIFVDRYGSGQFVLVQGGN